MITFFDKKTGDKAYLDWVEKHPEGYIINTYQEPTASYLVLHRSGCHTITQYTNMAQPGGFTERQYSKVCADTVDELKTWIRQQGLSNGSFTKECRKCNPC